MMLVTAVLSHPGGTVPGYGSIYRFSQEPEEVVRLPYYGGAKGNYLLVPASQLTSKKEEEGHEEEIKEEGEKEEEKEEEQGMAGGDDAVAINPPPPGASVAEVKPVGVAVAGEGGVAVSKPIGSAIVGPGGLAIARPIATAIAGVPVSSGGIPIGVAPAGKYGFQGFKVIPGIRADQLANSGSNMEVLSHVSHMTRLGPPLSIAVGPSVANGKYGVVPASTIQLDTSSGVVPASTVRLIDTSQQNVHPVQEQIVLYPLY